MKRFHRKVRVRIPNGPIFREPITNTRFGAKEFDSQWRHLNRTCGDPASRARLSWLREQFVRHRRGVSDAAQAEVDLASLFLRAGFSVSFLPESWVRTADLECYLGHDRLFVEVTVIVPTERRTPNFSGRRLIGRYEGNTLEDLDVPGKYIHVLEGMPQGEPYNVGQMYYQFGQSILSADDCQPDFKTAVELHRFIDNIREASDQGREVTVRGI